MTLLTLTGTNLVDYSTDDTKRLRSRLAMWRLIALAALFAFLALCVAVVIYTPAAGGIRREHFSWLWGE